MFLKKIALICFAFITFSCDELQQVVDALPNDQTGTTLDIAGGLRQALDFGIEKQVSKLTKQDGFYGNSMVKILLPDRIAEKWTTL